MDINRVIKAIQRTSHLSDKQMWNDYYDLYFIKAQIDQKERSLNHKLDIRSRIAVIKEIACPLGNNYKKEK